MHIITGDLWVLTKICWSEVQHTYMYYRLFYGAGITLWAIHEGEGNTAGRKRGSCERRWRGGEQWPQTRLHGSFLNYTHSLDCIIVILREAASEGERPERAGGIKDMVAPTDSGSSSSPSHASATGSAPAPTYWCSWAIHCEWICRRSPCQSNWFKFSSINALGEYQWDHEHKWIITVLCLLAIISNYTVDCN